MGHAYVVKQFTETLQRPGIDPNVLKSLQALCKLYAVQGMNERLGDFMQDGFISGQQAEMITEKLLALYAEIRPNAVALVDAFDYPDQVLQSCLGRYDGRVYEALYEYAKSSPMNKEDVLPSYHTTLGPLMRGEQLKNTPAARL